MAHKSSFYDFLMAELYHQICVRNSNSVKLVLLSSEVDWVIGNVGSISSRHQEEQLWILTEKSIKCFRVAVFSS